MKYLFPLILLAFLDLPTPGQKNYTEVDLKVNGISSGSIYSAVLKKLGKPLRSRKENYSAENACSGQDETHLTLVYSGLKIVFLGDGKARDLTVYSIEVTSPNWVIGSGIRIGAGIEKVRGEFGKTEEYTESEQTTLAYVIKENLGSVDFYFQNNKLVRVEMVETLC